ncbi:MAG: hypothetical protein QUV07_16250 [Cyanobium sp. CZS 25K]|nr:hypothetical protein [Cyanobium sp. CZS25K]
MKSRQEAIELLLQFVTLLLDCLPLRWAQIDSSQAAGEACDLLGELPLRAGPSGEQGLTLLNLLQQTMAIETRKKSKRRTVRKTCGSSILDLRGMSNNLLLVCPARFR